MICCHDRLAANAPVEREREREREREEEEEKKKKKKKKNTKRGGQLNATTTANSKQREGAGVFD